MSSVPSVGDISGYHAHVYFSAETLAQAQALCESAAALFDIEMGRVHQKSVGPHPCWSCQLVFSPEIFSALVPWLALHRDGLTILVHPLSGDELRDHRDYAMWMGKVEVLDLNCFSR
ncbi:MAG: DOPA 4,5-dioxygenase family protein [Gammaproteobacteria bacterium]|nr:DOPA 4,5-dioxygenase family protein [Gammaproteobacteria bacterium]